MIIKDSHIPIYFQLETEIKELVKGLNPGDPISSEREFAEKYDISRMTVRQAINNLVNEGILVRKRGKGTFVAAQKVEQPLSGLTSFSEDMRSRGMKPQTKILSFQQISSDKNIAAKLKIEENMPVYEVSRLRLADESPMALEVSYLPAHIITDLTKKTIHASLYDYIEKELQLTISHASQTLESSLAQGNECNLLKIEEGDPVLLIERYSYLENGAAFEYVKSIYRGDRYKFVIDMKR